MSVPQPRRVHDLRNRSRALTTHSESGAFKQTRAWSERSGYRRTCHRLTWFEALQGLSLIAIVMLGGTHALLSGLLICSAIAMCVLAILMTCIKGKDPRSMHLVFAILWAFIGAIYTFVHMS